MQGLDGLRRYSRILRAAVLRDRPVYAHIGITHRCDLTCRMCGIWKYGNKAEEMSLDQVGTVASVLRDLGVVQVSIGGGEPFCRDDLADIIRIFRDRHLPTRVLTNGVNLTDARIREVADAGLQAVSVSFDSLSRQRMGWICVDDQAWDKAVTNLVRFSNLLPKSGGILVMNTVVSRENLAELPDLVKFASFLGYWISLLPIELAEDPHDRSNRFITHQPRMKVNPEDMARLEATYDQLILMKARGAPILSTTPYLVASRRYFRTGAFPGTCDAGRLYFSISPTGMVTVCHRGPELKRMLEPDATAYLRSSAFKRAAQKEAQACAGCIRPCWMDTSRMFTTSQGFLETAVVTLRARRPRPEVRQEEALAWARA